MIEPTPKLRLKLGPGEAIRVRKVGKCGTVIIEGPYTPPVRYWTRSEWEKYTEDAERLPDEPRA